MHTVSQQELVHIWEVGMGLHPLDQALTILATAFPDIPQKQLVALSVGQRDECLFAIRQKIFGGQLASFITCPQCQEPLELTLDLADLPISPNPTPIIFEQTIQEMHSDNYTFLFRLPNSLDLAALIGSRDILAARLLLLGRCILQVSYNAIPIHVEDVPETVIHALTTHMDSCDPLAALDITLDCTACGQRLHILFDIVTFLWTEISTQAKRLLHEVHTLARAYGWPEADILSMSSARRQFYLEMVS